MGFSCLFPRWSIRVSTLHVRCVALWCLMSLADATRVSFIPYALQIESSEELVGTVDKRLVQPEHSLSSLLASLRRPYNRTKRARRDPKPRKVQELKPISSIVDGSAFKPLKFNRGKPTCCLAHRCNDKYNEEVVQALRDAVPATGKDGCRKQRMVYVQERTASLPGNRYQLFLDDIIKEEVCIPYFCAVTGVSTGLLYAARRASDLGGTPRVVAGAMKSVIAAYLDHLGQRWETQPGNNDVYLPFPSKKFVYNMFCFDRWWKNVYRDTPPTYANFVTVWNNVCPFLKLKQEKE